MVQARDVAPAALCRESTTMALNVISPPVRGVPLNDPVAGLSVNPAGRPLAKNAYGLTPPDAVRLEEYKTPTCPLPAGDVTEGGGDVNPKSIVSSTLEFVDKLTFANTVTPETVPLLSMELLEP